MTERWLIIGNEATNSGAPRMLLKVLRGVKAERGPGWSCDIILRRGGVLLSEFRLLGPVQVLAHPWSEGRTLWPGVFRKFFDRLWHQPWQLRKCVRRLRENRYNLVYNNTATNEHVVFAARHFGCPVLTHVHELEDTLKRFTSDRGIAQTIQGTDHFLAVSQAVADDLGKLGVATERITVTPNFLSTLPEIPDETERLELRDRLGLPTDAFVVVGCGYVHWLKGTDLFVEVAASLVSRIPKKMIFVWLGFSPDAAFARKVAQMIKERGLQAVVRFAGEVESTGQWFAVADVVAVTSRVESFSLVALEAGAAAKPVVGFSAARGLMEFIGEEPGLISHDLNPSVMASHLVKLLEDPVEADRHGQRLRKKVECGYLSKPRIRAILAVVDELKQSWKTEP